MNLPSGGYILGASFINSPNGNFSVYLLFGMAASICDCNCLGSGCELIPVRAPFGSNVSYTIGPDSEDMFSSTLSIAPGAATWETDPNIQLNLRRNGNPFTQKNETDLNDGNSVDGLLTINNPGYGDYYIAATILNPTNQQDFSISITSKSMLAFIYQYY